ncbi:unnamed protein product [Protopolystoma xenopodis]|uniref:Uncharacterized protein n=1 Tax=Protopolystoma xenopodis TaxID=117903 RepID=A0A3S4ZTZ6_9PLAT|nr:unnamed protein product [Protopolystoma xenopodis]
MLVSACRSVCSPLFWDTATHLGVGMVICREGQPSDHVTSASFGRLGRQSGRPIHRVDVRPGLASHTHDIDPSVHQSLHPNIHSSAHLIIYSSDRPTVHSSAHPTNHSLMPPTRHENSLPNRLTQRRCLDLSTTWTVG